MSQQAGPAQEFFSGLLPKSKFAVDMAEHIRRSPGLEGVMVVALSADPRTPCEVMVVQGAWGLSVAPEVFMPHQSSKPKR